MGERKSDAESDLAALLEGRDPRSGQPTTASLEDERAASIGLAASADLSLQAYRDMISDRLDKRLRNAIEALRRAAETDDVHSMRRCRTRLQDMANDEADGEFS